MVTGIIHNILLFKSALFLIHTGVNFFLFSKFLPMKVRQWRPMLDARYGMEILP